MANQQAYFFEQSNSKENNIISFSVNNPFYLYAPSYYKTYYSTYLNTCLKYYDGNYNVKFGENAVFTNNLALQSIVRGLKNKLFANGIDFTGENKPRNRMVAWAKESKLLKTLKKFFEYSLAGGTALLTINRDKKHELYLSAHRIDNYFVDVTPSGEIERVQIFQDIIHDTTQEESVRDHYMIMMERYFDNEQPIEVLNVYRGTGNIQTEGQSKPNLAITRTALDWNSIPKRIRQIIRKEYPYAIIGEKNYLPFKDDLGCAIYSWTDGNPRIPNSVLGQPIADTLQNECIQYDQLKYFEKVEVKLARARANVSSEYVNPDDPEQQSTLDPEFYVTVENGMENGGITPIQFNLRADQIRVQKENILRDIAFKLNVSASTIATFLNEGSGSKTATEVINERTTTDSFFKDQKRALEEALDNILMKVRLYLGVGVGECNLDIKCENQEPFLDKLKVEGQGVVMGIVSPKRYIKDVMTHLSQTEQEEEIEYINNFLASQMKAQQVKQAPQSVEEKQEMDTVYIDPENQESVSMRNQNKTNFEKKKE